LTRTYYPKEIFTMAKKNENKVWNGKVVKKLRYLNRSELAREGWDTRQKVAAVEFSDGSLLYASSDPEGNGPGALFGTTPEGQTVWVSP
jgi:hypothetical protein